MSRYEQITNIVEFARPKTIIEIGTNTGIRAQAICREALKHNKSVHYIGYDLFEDATDAINGRELNAKGRCSEQAVAKLLGKIEGLTFELVKGDTRKTLHGTEIYADFAFIDGGHSVETIRGDYEAIKGSPVILFDDYYMPTADIDTTKFGCNSIVDALPHEILPAGNSIKMAVVGYSSTWKDAFKRIRKDDNIDSIAIWRPEMRTPKHMIAALELEKLQQPGEVLEKIRALCKRRMFFTVKQDALRSLDYWRDEIGKRFEIKEWFGSQTEICGTAAPLSLVGELKAVGAVAEDDRFEQIKENVKVTTRRLPACEPHGNRALIVCYGPSINDTWPHLMSQLKFEGGDVFSVSGAHDFIVRRGVIPKYHVECDPRPHKKDNINLMTEETQYLIASCCHPSLVEKLKPYNLVLWHSLNGQDSVKLMDQLEPDQFMVGGGGSAGLRAITVAHVLGYRHFSIYGMDCSFKDGEQWAGPHVGKRKDEMEVVCDGRKFKTSAVNIAYARHFMETVQNAPDSKFTLIGDGLLQTMARAASEGEEAA